MNNSSALLKKILKYVYKQINNSGFPWSSIGEYLQLPSHSLPFYSSCAEQSTNCADADAVQVNKKIREIAI